MNSKEKQLVENVVLVIVLSLMLLLLLFFRYNYMGQVLVGLFTSVFYVTWGIIHRAMEGRVTRFIVAEYVSVGVFVFLMLLTALTF
jgi:hypothetical protein